MLSRTSRLAMLRTGAWSRRLAWTLAVTTTTLLAACGGGDPAAPDVLPTVRITSSAGASVASGATLQLSVSATNRRGAAVSNPPVTWTSSAPTVASVSASGAVTGAVAGTSTITATYDGVSATFGVTVTPGAPARLALRTQPAGASSGLAFTTQPVVEILDAAGNVVTTSTIGVTASLASGSGSLGGVSVLNATQGVVSYADLNVTGTIGARTLLFSAAGLTPVTSDAFTLAAGAPSRLALRVQPAGAASGAPFTTQPVVDVLDAADNLVTTATTAVTASIADGGGTLSGTTTVTASQGAATYSTLRLDGLVGNRTLRFSAPGLSPATSAVLTLQPGAAAALAVRTAPTGGGLNSNFTTQPVIEVRDAAGNLAVTSNVSVTASVTAGGGSLTGATTNAVNGVATFSGFGIAGNAGARTIAVNASGLTAASFSVNPCDIVRAPQLRLSKTATTIDAAGTIAGFDTLLVTDNLGSCQAILGVGTSIAYAGAAGWLSASVLGTPTRVVLRADPAAVAVGTYQATVTVTSANAGSTPLPVTFEARPAVSLTYADANEKVRQLDPNGTLLVPAVVRSGASVITAPVTYTSRAATIATVAADGTITGRVGGQTWIVASTPLAADARDSLFVNVTRTTGPLLRADVTRFTWQRNVDFSVSLYLDTRGATVGAADMIFTWPSTLGTPGLLRLNNVVAGTTGNPVITSDAGSGTTRISIASATGMNGLILLGRFDFTPQFLGTSQLVLRFNEILGPQQQSLLPNASALQYPVVVR